MNYRWGKLKGMTKKLTSKRNVRSASIFEMDKDEAIMNCDYLLESHRIDLLNSMNLN